jgi:hypothetical protein
MDRLQNLLTHESQEWEELLIDLTGHERRVVYLLQEDGNPQVEVVSPPVRVRHLDVLWMSSLGALQYETLQGLDVELDKLRKSRDKFETLSSSLEITGQLLFGESSHLPDTDSYHPTNVRVETDDWPDYIEDVIIIAEGLIDYRENESSQTLGSDITSPIVSPPSDFTVPFISKPSSVQQSSPIPALSEDMMPAMQTTGCRVLVIVHHIRCCSSKSSSTTDPKSMSGGQNFLSEVNLLPEDEITPVKEDMSCTDGVKPRL